MSTQPSKTDPCEPPTGVYSPIIHERDLTEAELLALVGIDISTNTEISLKDCWKCPNLD